MKLTFKNPVVLMLLCLMAGLFITVSFLETPLKFQVPGMTLPVALGLGKLMFGISTQIQCGILILIFLIMVMRRKSFSKRDFVTTGVLLLVVIIEKFWMLPVLNARIDLLSVGKSVSPSEIHTYFIYTEIAKLILLIFTIALQFKTNRNGY